MNRHVAQIFLAIVAGVLLLINCSRDKSPRQIVIAKVGDRTIDWRLLERSYYLNPKWGRGLTQQKSFENQLNYLVNQKLFAQAALSEGIPDEISMHLKFIKEKEMIKALYRQEVASHVEISDAEYERGYQRLKKKVKLEFILTPDIANARRYVSELKTSPVDAIRLISPENEEKGVTPLFGFGEMSPSVEDVVFDMRQGETAGPIPVGNNYLAIKLIDGQVEKFMSRMDFMEKLSKIRKVIYDRKAQLISHNYIYGLMKEQAVKINPRTFAALTEQFSRIIENKKTDAALPVYVNNRELKTTETNLRDIADEVLVTYKTGQLTVREFIGGLLNMPAGMRPQVKLAPQLKKAIGIAVRNLYLAKRAYRQGLDQTPEVCYEAEWQCDEVLSRYWLKKIRDKLTASEDEIAAFKKTETFKKVSKRFNGRLTDEALEDVVLDYKFVQRQIEVGDSLSVLYPIAIDTALFHKQLSQPNKIIKSNPVRLAYRELFQ